MLELERITASHELAFEQRLNLVGGYPPGRVELTLHQHIRLLPMEHCLFCAFLCEGHGQIDCRCGLTWAAATPL